MKGPPAKVPRLKPAAWQKERARILHCLVRTMEKQKAKGVPIRKTARRYCRRWNGQPYITAPRHFIQLSIPTLIRIYYRWLRARTPAAFALQYAPTGKRLVPRAFLHEAFRRYQLPNAISAHDVLRGMEKEWQRGIELPGVCDWKSYSRRVGKQRAHGKYQLPHAYTFYRYARGLNLRARKKLLRQREAAEKALREFDKNFTAQIATRLEALPQAKGTTP